MLKRPTLLRHATIAAIAAALFSLPMTSVALARHGAAGGTRMNGHSRDAVIEPAEQCEIVDAISHRCLIFHSDLPWPENQPDYDDSNGG